MLKSVIIDDEPMAVQVIASHIDKIAFLSLEAQFTDAIKAIEWLEEHPIDLLFLDIDMPDISGLDLLRTLTKPPKVIFTTAHPDHALESYDFDSIDYLLKPITFSRFLKASNKAKQLITPNSLSNNHTSTSPLILHLKSGTSTYRVPVTDIQYIEGTGNYLTVFTISEKIMVLQTMKEMEQQLPTNEFMRIHRSYIIAKKHIKRIEKASVQMIDEVIPVGNSYRSLFATWVLEK